MRGEKKCYLAVWRREGTEKSRMLPIAGLAGRQAAVRCIYPSYATEKFNWNERTGTLSVEFEKEKTARLYEVTWS